jgi:hypothetical protein
VNDRHLSSDVGVLCLARHQRASASASARSTFTLKLDRNLAATEGEKAVTDRIEAAAKEFARLIWQRESTVSEVLKFFPDLTDAEIDLAWQRARAWSDRFLE